MKKRNIYLSLWSILGLLALVVASCSEDIPYVEPFPDMEISFSDLHSTYYYGETLALTPSIQYGDNELANFTVNWYFVDGNQMNLISGEKNLELVLDTLGKLTLYCEVTNNETNFAEGKASAITVQSVTSQGWYVLKETQDGNTDMDGFFVGSETPVFNIIKSNLGAPLTGAPKALMVSPQYMIRDTSQWNGYSQTVALMPFSEHDGFVFGVNNASVLASMNDLFKLSPGISEYNVSGGSFTSSKITLSTNGRTYSMLNGNPAFYPAMEGDYRIDKYFTGGYYGNSLAFDDKNKRFVLIGGGYNTTDTIGYFKDAYHDLNNGVEVPVNNMSGELLFLENAILNYNWSANYIYALFKESGETNSLTLLGLDYEKFISGYYWGADIYAGDYSPVTYKATLEAAEYPKMVDADIFTMDKTIPVMYFANNGSIGSYNIQSGVYNEDFITDIPSGEEITFMKYIVSEYSDEWGADPGFSGLVVATYNASANTYQVYRYKVEGLNTVSRVDDVMTGTGKVSKVVFVQADAGFYSWSGDLYLYYN